MKEERYELLAFSLRRFFSMENDVRGLAKAWQFAGAGPIERWVMAVWTEASWIAKAAMCFALGHRMQVKPYPETPEEEEPTCVRCGWSAEMREVINASKETEEETL